MLSSSNPVATAEFKHAWQSPANNTVNFGKSPEIIIQSVFVAINLGKFIFKNNCDTRFSHLQGTKTFAVNYLFNLIFLEEGGGVNNYNMQYERSNT